MARAAHRGGDCGGESKEAETSMIPPIMLREFRVALRKREPMKARLRVAGVATLVALVLLLLGLLLPGEFGGRTLQTGLFYAGLYFAVVRPAEITVGLFSEERRSQTLELLYLAGMSSMELFSGKVLGGAL